MIKYCKYYLEKFKLSDFNVWTNFNYSPKFINPSCVKFPLLLSQEKINLFKTQIKKWKYCKKLRERDSKLEKEWRVFPKLVKPLSVIYAFL